MNMELVKQGKKWPMLQLEEHFLERLCSTDLILSFSGGGSSCNLSNREKKICVSGSNLDSGNYFWTRYHCLFYAFKTCHLPSLL